jgi:hypothetical protein
MIESRNDFVLRILDEIAFLSVRLAGLQAMGLSEEVLNEVDKLEQAAGRLEADDRTRVEGALSALRGRVSGTGATPGG